MQYPITSGRAADLLSTSEPRLADLVRRGKIRPPPEVISGRRVWQPMHLLQAAEVLGVLDERLRARLAEMEVHHAS